MLGLTKIKCLSYAVNGIGLGHITRLLAINLALKKQVAYPFIFEPFFFTNSEASSILAHYQIPFVCVPSKRLLSHLKINSGSQCRLYANILNDVFDQFKPNLIITDTFPLGVFRDLEFLLRNSNAFHVYIHRAKKIEAHSPASTNSQLLYDLIVAPHAPDSEYIPLPEITPHPPLFWSGPIILDTFQSPEVLYKEGIMLLRNLGIPFINTQKTPVILINLGGGGDGNFEQLFQIIFQALKQLPQNVYFIWAMGLLSNYVSTTEFPENHKYIQTYPLTALYPFISISISTAGYNAFHELLINGVPTIFLPQKRGFDDQFLRVQRAQEAKSCLAIENMAVDSLESSIQSIYQAVTKLLTSEEEKQTLKLNAQKYIPHNGVENLAHEIIQCWNIHHTREQETENLL